MSEQTEVHWSSKHSFQLNPKSVDRTCFCGAPESHGEHHVHGEFPLRRTDRDRIAVLEAENRNLSEYLAKAHEHVTEAEQRVTTLEAENAGLKVAGDAMADRIRSLHDGTSEMYLAKWDAAKGIK